MNKRNGLIELYRFVAAASVAYYHSFYFFPPVMQPARSELYVWVEFFFILSGFFLADNCRRNNGGDAKGYVWSQIRKLFPLYAAALLFTLVVEWTNSGGGLKRFLALVYSAKWEIVMLSGLGIDATIYNGPVAAFITCLLFATLVLFYLVKEHRDLFIYVLGPVIIAVFYVHIVRYAGSLSVWFQYSGLMSMGMLRGLADMSVGVMFHEIAWPAVAGLKKRTSIPSLVAIAFCTAAICVLYLFESPVSWTDGFYYVIIFGLLITCLATFSPPEKLNRACCFVGRLAYPILLFHYGLLRYLSKFVPTLGNVKCFCIYAALVFFISVAAVAVQTLYRHFVKKKAAAQGRAV